MEGKIFTVNYPEEVTIFTANSWKFIMICIHEFIMFYISIFFLGIFFSRFSLKFLFLLFSFLFFMKFGTYATEY